MQYNIKSIILIALLLRVSNILAQEQSLVDSIKYNELGKNQIAINGLTIEQKDKLYNKFHINTYKNMIAGIIPFYGHCRIKKWTRVLSIFIVGSMLSTIFNAEIFGGGGVASGQVGKKLEERYETQEDQRDSLISLLLIADLYFETNKYNKNLYNIIYGSSPKENK